MAKPKYEMVVVEKADHQIAKYQYPEYSPIPLQIQEELWDEPLPPDVSEWLRSI